MSADWKDIAGVVGKFAPLAGTLIGGPAGAAIGALLSAALGTDGTPDALHAAIAADPQASLKLAEFESDNKVKLQALAFTHADNVLAAETAALQADVADRTSARAREATVRDKTPSVLAGVVIASGIAFATAVVFGLVTKDPSQAALVGTVMGYILSESKVVTSYYFGSSSGSARKTELLKSEGDGA